MVTSPHPERNALYYFFPNLCDVTSAILALLAATLCFQLMSNSMFAHERSRFYNMKTELQNYNLFTATEHDDRAFPVLLIGTATKNSNLQWASTSRLVQKSLSFETFWCLFHHHWPICSKVVKV